MSTFEGLAEFGCEQLVFCHDESTGLRAIIAVHDTTLGPALGGCRMWPYRTEEEAVVDVLRLARGMTYKAAVSGLNLGGGKSVILGDPDRDKTGALFRAFGRFVETLGGRYVVAEDVGTSPEDMEQVRTQTSHAVGLEAARGGSGDPSPFTALGVLAGMRACAEEVFGTPSLEGLTVAVQGLGHVGYALCRLLHEEGARLVVADLHPDRAERAAREFGAKPVGAAEILSVPCDVFAPCALGAVVNDETLPGLRAAIVAGSANNVLAEGRHGEALLRRGILYAPDYVINAGGLIHVASEVEGYDEEGARGRVEGIYDSVKNVIGIAKKTGVATNVAADGLALERLRAARKLDRRDEEKPLATTGSSVRDL